MRVYFDLDVCNLTCIVMGSRNTHAHLRWKNHPPREENVSLNWFTRLRVKLRYIYTQNERGGKLGTNCNQAIQFAAGCKKGTLFPLSLLLPLFFAKIIASAATASISMTPSQLLDAVEKMGTYSGKEVQYSKTGRKPRRNFSPTLVYLYPDQRYCNFGRFRKTLTAWIKWH